MLKGFVKLDLAFVDHYHGDSCCHRLGDRRNPENRVAADRLFPAEDLHTDRIDMDLVAASGERHAARDIVASDVAHHCHVQICGSCLVEFVSHSLQASVILGGRGK